MCRSAGFLVGFSVVALLAPSAGAQESLLPIGDGSATISTSFGVVAMEGREYFFDGVGPDTIGSLLVWSSLAPTLNLGFDITTPEGWTFALQSQIASGGDSLTTDTDWFGPDFIDYAPENWTHKSWHPGAELDWYLNGSMAVGHDFVINEGVTSNLNVGFRYTDVHWTVHGGHYVYSSFPSDFDSGFPDQENIGFRGIEGDFPPTGGYPYEQMFPVVFVGTDLELAKGNWIFDVSAQGGVTVNAKAVDTRFPFEIVDLPDSAPFLALAAHVEYLASSNLSFTLDASVEKNLFARSGRYVRDLETGDIFCCWTDAGGAELGSASISGGVKGRF